MVTFAKFLPLICLSISSYGCYCLTSPAWSQIIPDGSLKGENSLVTPNVFLPEKTAIADYLEGGAVRGKNLFHSFREFNVAAQNSAYFASPPGIDHIFTRITGTNPSQIEGTLGVDGSANLFLLNPHGVLFGTNSQLDLAGSLLVTTGDRYIFDNDFSFSATNPEIPPLLTLNLPVSIQFGSAPGEIVNRARRVPEAHFQPDTNQLVSSIPEGLRINQGQNLSFLGGEILIEGGYFNTEGSTIAIGAVGAGSTVQLSPDGQHWQLDYAEVDTFADLQFNQNSGIDGGQVGRTRIALTGKNISLGYDIAELEEYSSADFFSLEPLTRLDELPTDQIVISAQNQEGAPTQIDIQAAQTFSIVDPGKKQQNLLVNSVGSGNGGQINVTAEQIVLYGGSLESWSLSSATGNAGSINFMAEDMTVQYSGAGVNTDGRGNAGAINLDIAGDLKIQYGGFGGEVFDSVDDQEIRTNSLAEMDAKLVSNGGEVKINAQNLEISSGGIGVNSYSAGNGGKIDLNIAQNLKVISGGFGADAFGEGNGGSIEIDAQNIELINAGMGANTRGGDGKGGDINLNAATILLENGLIGAESGQDKLDERNANEEKESELFRRDAGDGGNIFIEADKLLIDNGNITTSTFGKGNAGDIQLQVNSLTASGTVEGDLVTGINSSTDGAGQGGNISIYSDRINLADEAIIAANSTAQGQAGNIEIYLRDRLLVERQGTISVDGGTTGLPGEIIIQSQHLLLNSGGRISATTNQGTQGNIRLQGKSLLLEGESQIVTNAGKDATGGNIFIDLQHNLLGLHHSKITASAEQGQGGNISITTRGLFFDSNSQINASSQFGIDGLISVDTLDVDPNADLIQLPNEPIDPNLYLSRGCGTNRNNQFSSVGKGGLAENPLTSISQDYFLADLEPLAQLLKLNSELAEPTLSQVKPLVEAQAWRMDRHGKVELIATEDSAMKQQYINCL
ncbi:MAG: S-layer family protein [Cyanobacteria bacterium J06600_6]